MKDKVIALTVFAAGIFLGFAVNDFVSFIETRNDVALKCIVNTRQTPEQYAGPGEYHGVYKGDLLVLLPCK
jgi:hypothetical protein